MSYANMEVGNLKEIPIKKKTALWRFLNLCKTWCFVRRPIKLRIKKRGRNWRGEYNVIV